MNDETQNLATDSQADDPYADMRASKPWLDAIEDSRKCLQTYFDKCRNIEKQYADIKRLSGERVDREMQVFWANLEVLKPSIYSRPPVPVVAARFNARDEIKQHASEILERSLISTFEMSDIDQTMISLRDDLAMTARAAPWVRYSTESDMQEVKFDALDREDFAHEPARKWKEVGWVAKRSYLTRRQMAERFEETSQGAWMQADFKDQKSHDQDKDQSYSADKKACVWEIWSKDRRVVVWVSPGVESVLDIRPPFLDLQGFFPCPRPAYGTCEPRSLVPVPDFLFYKDQLEEINELTARISALSEALRMKGFYSAGNEDLSSAIERVVKSTEDRSILVPVSSNAALGGASLKDAIVWLPVAEIASTIQALIGLRQQLMSDVYEITGLSDIMRGATDPNETLGAQQLKSQYGSVRVRDRQAELVRVALDMTRIAGEIIAENFDPATLRLLSQYSGVRTAQEVSAEAESIRDRINQARSNPEVIQQAQQNPDQAQQLMQQAQERLSELQSEVTFEAVVEMLQSERLRPFALEIETDSTIMPDENANKQRVSEFLQALAMALGQLGPMVAQQPASAPFAGEMLKFAVKPFRAGRELMSAIDEFVEKANELAAQPKPNPEMEKVKTEQATKTAELQMEKQRSDADIEKIKAEIAKLQAETARILGQAEVDIDQAPIEVPFNA